MRSQHHQLLHRSTSRDSHNLISPCTEHSFQVQFTYYFHLTIQTHVGKAANPFPGIRFSSGLPTAPEYTRTTTYTSTTQPDPQSPLVQRYRLTGGYTIPHRQPCIRRSLPKGRYAKLGARSRAPINISLPACCLMYHWFAHVQIYKPRIRYMRLRLPIYLGSQQDPEARLTTPYFSSNQNSLAPVMTITQRQPIIS